MKRFDKRCLLFRHFYEAAAKLINFLHRRRMIFDRVVREDQEENEEHYGWGGDFEYRSINYPGCFGIFVRFVFVISMISTASGSCYSGHVHVVVKHVKAIDFLILVSIHFDFGGVELTFGHAISFVANITVFWSMWRNP